MADEPIPQPTPPNIPTNLTGWQWVTVQVCMILASVATLYIQSHNQHADRMNVADVQHVERIKALKAIENKLPNRPPVFHEALP